MLKITQKDEEGEEEKEKGRSFQTTDANDTDKNS